MEKAREEDTFYEKTWQVSSRNALRLETSGIVTHTMDLRDTGNLYESTWGSQESYKCFIVDNLPSQDIVIESTSEIMRQY